MSEISNTDALLYKKLANPEVVNLEVVERQRKRRAPVVQEMMERAVRRSEQERREEGEPREEPREERREERREEPREERREERREGAEAGGGGRAESDEAARSSRKRRREDEDAGERVGEDPARESEAAEKQGLLIELQALEARGVRLTRSFTIESSAADMEFEISRHAAASATRNGVAFLRDALRLLVTGIDLGNARFGPFLSIEGWAESITGDMARYDHTLERIYKRYWRRQQMNPVLELAGLLVGSMVTWHFRSKFLGPSQAARPQAPQRGAPAPGEKTGAAEALRRTRPTLRPPAGGLFARAF